MIFGIQFGNSKALYMYNIVHIQNVTYRTIYRSIQVLYTYVVFIHACCIYGIVAYKYIAFKYNYIHINM